ncbi:MAG: insulinase family protein [Ignavibacteriae bacterium]|nr:insulinase family protein [Ignavibacteriota bacterium]
MNNIFKYSLTILFTFIFVMTSFSADELDRTKRPTPKPAPVVSLPDIQKATLSNGLQVWLVEQHELPTFAFNLVIHAGSDHDPVSMPGLATMTADVLDEGTATRDALAIAEELETIGASLNVNAGTDGSFFTLSSLSKHFDMALNVFADVLLNPVFPEKEFDRLKKQRLTTLLQQKDQPVSIANNAFSFLLYGSSHPYGNNSLGTETSLNALTQSDLVKFYQSYYVPNNATLIAVGDLNMNDVVSKLEASLKSWKKNAVAPLNIPTPAAIEKSKIFIIDKPGAAQSEIRMGYPALARSTPDYFPVLAMNRMLGGQFSSRINMNLREKHGFTYGARSGFSFYKNVGPFIANAPVVTEKTDSSLQELFYEINLMRDKGMTDDELKFVKNGLIGGFALTFETPAQIAGGLQNIALYGLPDNYFATYLQNIENVSLDDVQRVSKKYLDTSTMYTLVVGDLAKIKDGIKALNVSEVIECTIDGTPKQ